MTSKDRDLVEELLTKAHPSNVDVTDRAAARIEALSAENERLREALRSAIRNIENLTYDIKCHTECAECQNNVAMYEHAVEEYSTTLGESK